MLIQHKSNVRGKKPTKLADTIDNLRQYKHNTAIIITSVIRVALYVANLIIIEHNIVRSTKQMCAFFYTHTHRNKIQMSACCLAYTTYINTHTHYVRMLLHTLTHFRSFGFQSIPLLQHHASQNLKLQCDFEFNKLIDAGTV